MVKMAPNLFPQTRSEAATLAMQATAFLVSQPQLVSRFLDMTGLQPADLRSRIEDEVLLAQCLDFLAGHEPDLLACAAALDCSPARLMQALELLQQPA